MDSAWAEADALKQREYAATVISRKLFAQSDMHRRARNLVWRHFRRLPAELATAVLFANYEAGTAPNPAMGPQGDHAETLVAADWLRERGFTIQMRGPETEAQWRPMTAEERQAAIALFGCTFSVGSFDKRFARSLHAQADAVDQHVISRKQAALLPKMITRYRRQIRASDLAESWRHLLNQEVRA